MKALINKLAYTFVVLVLVVELVLILGGGFGLFSNLSLNASNALILYTVIGWILPASIGLIITEATDPTYY